MSEDLQCNEKDYALRSEIMMFKKLNENFEEENIYNYFNDDISQSIEKGLKLNILNKMKKHNAFVIQFLKDVGHPELIDIWCSNFNQEQFRKIRFLKENREKKRCTCYILFCIDRRSELQKQFPYLPNTRITALLAEEWRQHRDENDDVYQKYRTVDEKQVFFKKHKNEIGERYPRFTSNEVSIVLEKMFEKLSQGAPKIAWSRPLA